MQVSTEWMEEHFHLYNRQYFDGQLPVPKMLVNNARTRLGTMTYRCRRQMFSTTYTDFTIRLTNYYNLSEEEYTDVLLHEMIHLSIAANGSKDTSLHGSLFRKKMAEINADGHHITVMKNVTETARNDTTQDKIAGIRYTNYVVLALTTDKGRCMLSVVNPSYILAINRSLKHAHTVKSYAWYVSDDPYFASFTRVRSPRGRVVSAEVYKRMVTLMRPLDVTNGKVGEPQQT